MTEAREWAGDYYARPNANELYGSVRITKNRKLDVITIAIAVCGVLTGAAIAAAVMI